MPRTPFITLDWKKVSHNAQKMLEKCERLGVRLRPHVKTHKTVELAHLQCGDKYGPITVSTLSELFCFHQNGFRDILYAVPITSQKLKDLYEVIQSGAHINICFDSFFMAQQLVEITKKWERKPSVYLEIDPGYQRCGFDYTSPTFAETIQYLYKNQFHVSAVMAHSGHSYSGNDTNVIDHIAKTEADVLNKTADLVESLVGHRPHTSAGSTPTSVLSESWQTIDEIRPGNYAIFDVFMHDLGVCSTDEIACSVETSVIGIYPERCEIVVDAGALALSKDLGHPSRNGHFGICVNYPDMKLTKLSQEHGTLKSATGLLPNLNIGDQVSILPNHSCLTLACYSQYHILGHPELKTVRPCREW